jgi:hypothetical protein
MRSKTFPLLVALALTLVAGPVAALDMVVGDVTVQNLGDFGFDTQGTDAPGAETGVLTFDGGVTDDLFQMFGYVGTAAGHVRIDSTNFDVSSAITQVGDSALSQLTLSAAGAAALGLTTGALTIDYTFTLIDDTGVDDSDRLAWDIDLTNTTTSAISMSLYAYVDLDLAGTFANDRATTDTSRMFVQDDAVATSFFVWDVVDVAGADHFQVGDYPTVRNALEGMTSNQDLSDTGASFGPSDFSGAYQFDRLLAPLSTQGVTLNTAVIPEPEPVLLTGLGLVGLAFYGRSRGRGRDHRR